MYSSTVHYFMLKYIYSFKDFPKTPKLGLQLLSSNALNHFKVLDNTFRNGVYQEAYPKRFGILALASCLVRFGMSLRDPRLQMYAVTMPVHELAGSISSAGYVCLSSSMQGVSILAGPRCISFKETDAFLDLGSVSDIQCFDLSPFHERFS